MIIRFKLFCNDLRLSLTSSMIRIDTTKVTVCFSVMCDVSPCESHYDMVFVPLKSCVGVCSPTNQRFSISLPEMYMFCYNICLIKIYRWENEQYYTQCLYYVQVYSRVRAGLRGGQTGQLPGAPHFGGPMNYLGNIFFTIYIKKKFLNCIFLIYY